MIPYNNKLTYKAAVVFGNGEGPGPGPGPGPEPTNKLKTPVYNLDFYSLPNFDETYPDYSVVHIFSNLDSRATKLVTDIGTYDLDGSDTYTMTLPHSTYINEVYVTGEGYEDSDITHRPQVTNAPPIESIEKSDGTYATVVLPEGYSRAAFYVRATNENDSSDVIRKVVGVFEAPEGSNIIDAELIYIAKEALGDIDQSQYRISLLGNTLGNKYNEEKSTSTRNATWTKFHAPSLTINGTELTINAPNISGYYRVYADDVNIVNPEDWYTNIYAPSGVIDLSQYTQFSGTKNITAIIASPYEYHYWRETEESDMSEPVTYNYSSENEYLNISVPENEAQIRIRFSGSGTYDASNTDLWWSYDKTNWNKFTFDSNNTVQTAIIGKDAESNVVYLKGVNRGFGQGSTANSLRLWLGADSEHTYYENVKVSGSLTSILNGSPEPVEDISGSDYDDFTFAYFLSNYPGTNIEGDTAQIGNVDGLILPKKIAGKSRALTSLLARQKIERIDVTCEYVNSPLSMDRVFSECYNLNDVTLHFKDYNLNDISSNNSPTYRIFHNINSNGTLYCPASCGDNDTILRDESCCPVSWTVVNI